MVRAPAVDAGLEDAAEEIHVGAHRVLGRELHVVGEAARELHRPHGGLQHRVRLHAQLVLHVDRAGGDERVDARRAWRGFTASPALRDVVVVGAGERADVESRTAAATARIASKSPGLAAAKPASITSTFRRSSWRADADLVVAGHGRARALLAVAHGGVEDDQLVFHGRAPGSGWTDPPRVAGAAGCCTILLGVGFLARGAAAAGPARARRGPECEGIEVGSPLLMDRL